MRETSTLGQHAREDGPGLGATGTLTREYARLSLAVVTGITVRRLDSSHAGALVDHFVRLDPDDRYRRFFGAMPDDRIADFVAQWDWTRHIVFGAVRGEQIVGVCEIAWSGHNGPGRADLGISVDRDVRDLGLASWLVREGCQAAAAHGVQILEGRWLRDNDAVTKIFRKLGAPSDIDGATRFAELRLDRAAQSALSHPCLISGHDQSTALDPVLLTPAHSSSARRQP